MSLARRTMVGWMDGVLLEDDVDELIALDHVEDAQYIDVAQRLPRIHARTHIRSSAKRIASNNAYNGVLA